MIEVLAYALLGLFLIMVPGFLFTLVLYPRLGSMDFWERMGGSLALGVLLLIYVGFTVARLKRLEALPFVGVVSVLCVALGLVAYLRGGFEVITAYKRAAPDFFRKLKRAAPDFFRRFKPPKPPEPSQPKEPEAQPEERGGEG